MPRPGRSTGLVSRQSVLFMRQRARPRTRPGAAARNSPRPLWLSAALGKETRFHLRAPPRPRLPWFMLSQHKRKGALPGWKKNKNKIDKVREKEGKKRKITWKKKTLYSINALDSFCDLVLTLALHNSGGVNGGTHLPPPAGTSAGPRARERPAPCPQQLQPESGQGREGGAATEHAHSPKYTCVRLHMQRYAPLFENYFWRPLSHQHHEFLQYASSSCQRSGIWSWSMKFSCVISESLISLLDRFSDVQLCFLYTKVQYFLHILCKQTQRYDFESN